MTNKGPILFLINILQKISSEKIRAGPKTTEIAEKLNDYRQKGSQILSTNETIFALLAKELLNRAREDRVAGLTLILKNRGVGDEEIVSEVGSFLYADRENLERIYRQVFG